LKTNKRKKETNKQTKERFGFLFKRKQKKKGFVFVIGDERHRREEERIVRRERCQEELEECRVASVLSSRF
jgi:hypothetical protein